ncbi:helix-turn-helix transcriptional regulator [Rhizobium leguminosarum]
MRFISSEELKAKGVTISRATLWRLIKKGQFPKPIKQSPSRNAWLESEVDEWMRSRVDARDRRPA